METPPDVSTAPPLPRWGASLYLAGPTAVGKSEVAVLLAEQLDAEIISVDSMQVYRGMDIGTAKASAPERARVPHHLIDVAEVSQPFNAAEFLRLAAAAAADMRRRGKLALFCGGTGMYFKALLEGVGYGPPGNTPLRAQLKDLGMPALLRELAERDPETYDRIDRQNPRRVIRAIEVLRLTGKSWSQQRSHWKPPGEELQLPFFALCRSPSDLHERIERRVEAMFSRGLVAETERLLQAGLADNPVALQALGYRQVVEFLNGKRSLAATIELVKIRTRQFAKRQLTWFRRQLPVRWVICQREQQAQAIASALINQFGARPTGA